MRYTIVIEKATRNFAAYAPDLPGCVATGATRDETIREMREAILLHLQSLREHGEPVPQPRSTAAVVEVAASNLLPAAGGQPRPNRSGNR